MLRAFAPLSMPQARVLVLGSMPGAASLQAAEYYAHPRNLFWDFMAEMFAIDRALPYAQRTQALTAQGVALWDVLQACEREGSLDSAIRNEIPNDFAAFFTAHPHITHVFTNGGTADKLFRRYVRDLPDGINVTRLPSTSPAYAALSCDKKRAAWQAVADAARV